MLSILPNSDNVSYVPIEIFQERIRNAIEEKTGKIFTQEELQQMDMGDIEKILRIETKRTTKIGRGPSSLYRFRSPENIAYNRAVINSLLMKENYFN